MTPILYQFWRSSASWRVRWALAAKRIPFESAVVDLQTGAQNSPEHLARNPMGRVPVLAIDGVLLTESVAIIEYLEERFPEPKLYPSSPLDRARVRQIVELVNSGVQPLQNTSVYKRHSSDDEAQKRWIRHWNEYGLEALEQLIGSIAAETGFDGPYAFGACFTAADIFLVPQVASARRFGVDLSKFARVARAEAAALTEPHAKGALPDNQPGAPRR
jgi:maleylacetoacetate isomerase